MKLLPAAAMLLPALAGANDGIGGVSAGGIVFGKTDAIAMKKEVLTVSHQLISVDYEFVNESARALEESIVFPLPPYAATNLPSDTYYGQPANFSITVDGKPVGFRTVVRALLGGEDVTAQLHGAGISDAQIANHERFTTRATVAPLSAAQRQRLVDLKLIGPGPSDEQEPLWEVQVNYVWQQRFPAGQTVRVHHAYRPFVSTGPAHWGMDGDTANRYCADAAFLNGWRRLAARNAGPDGAYPYLRAAKVAYILQTGNTWKNGIEDFTLNIVKQSPAELVSLCFPGTFQKTDARTFQLRLRNFRPSADLEVYFGNIDADGEPGDGVMPRVN
jgi:hypothetical protein